MSQFQTAHAYLDDNIKSIGDLKISNIRSLLAAKQKEQENLEEEVGSAKRMETNLKSLIVLAPGHSLRASRVALGQYWRISSTVPLLRKPHSTNYTVP